VPCQVVSITHDRDDRGPASLQPELTPSRITPQKKRTYQQVDVMIVQGPCQASREAEPSTINRDQAPSGNTRSSG